MEGSNQAFIIAAYTVMWIGLLGYLWRVVRKGGRARAEYERMLHQRGGENR